MRRFGLTTQGALKWAVCGGDAQLASKVADALVSEGKLVRRGKLLVSPKRTLSRDDLHHDYSVLDFCCTGQPLRPLVPRSDLRYITKPICDVEQIPFPDKHHLYVDRDKRLSLILVQPPPTGNPRTRLNGALVALQQFIEAKPFRLWAHFVERGGFSITYLMHDRGEAREFALWTERRPLVSAVLGEPVVVPLLVHVVRLCP